MVLVSAKGLNSSGYWQSGFASMAGNRYSHMGGVVGDYVYAIGGYSTVYHNTVYRYDIVNNSWATRTASSVNRAQAACATYGNYIFVFGGYDGTNYFGSTWRYDTAGNSWNEALAVFPGGALRRYSTACLVGDDIYVMGGQDQTPAYCGQNWKYDVSADTWSTLTSFPSGALRLGHCAVTHGTSIYVIAGRDASAYQKQVWKYDTIGDSWTTLASIPGIYGGAYAGIAIVNDFIYYSGGADLTLANSGAMHKYSIKENLWIMDRKPPTVFRAHRMEMYDDSLFLTGGYNDSIGAAPYIYRYII